MGAYLSAPNTEKISLDESHDSLDFGVSGMQGWRMSMEDAHSCLPNVDEKNNSLFAVFDGHGGREVAEYCGQNFHKFLLDTDAYHEGNIKAALKQAFMSIDEAITSDEVITILKSLGEPDEDGDVEEDEAELLAEEANMPIEQLLERLKGNVKDKLIENGILQDDSTEENEEQKEEKVNGYIEPVENGSSNSSRSRKQKNPVKRVVDEDDKESSATAAGNGSTPSNDSLSNAGSSSGGAPDKSSNDAGCSSSDPAASSTTSPTNALVDPTDDSDEEDSHDEDDEEEDEEGSEVISSDDSDEDEFTDGETVDFRPGSSDEVGKDSGTTAVVAVIHSNRLYVANAGDSRCVLCRNGKAFDMSLDHKPEDDIEKRRIEYAGGKITTDGRVNGGLNLSRAIGDHTYKQNKSLSAEEQVITACPDIKDFELTKDDSFMVLACDGIWNMMTSEEVIEFVKTRLDKQSEEKHQLSKICEELFDACLAPNTDNDGSGCDNMTCVIVRFKYDIHNKLTSGSKRRASEVENSDENKKSKKTKVSVD